MNIDEKFELEKYKAFFDGTLDGIFVLDKDGIIVDVNNAALNILGYKEKDIVGKKLTDFHSVEHREKCEMNIESAKMGERVCCDCPYVGADGKLIYSDNLLSLVKVDGVELVLVSFHDITKMRELEEKLKAEVDDLDKINEIMVGREMKIIELKDEIKNKKHCKR